MRAGTREDRYIGCLLGLAVGDALGTTLEFKAPGTFDPIDDMVGGGKFGLEPGQWTDDTSMALCLAESLLECRGFDAKDQMERYVRWRDHGHLSSIGRCFDIGITTNASLSQFQRTGDPYAGPTDGGTAGNGSIMRLAPLPMFYAGDATEALRKAADSSLTTHGARAAVDACRYMAGIIVGALVRGESKETLLRAGYSPVPGSWDDAPLHPEIAEVAAGSFKEKNPLEICGTGHVVRSLEAALWAFYHSDDFKTGALLAVNLGDDADTTGAVYGQIAGAYYGADDIPASWREKVTFVDDIESYATRLLGHVPTVQHFTSDAEVIVPGDAAVAKLLAHLDDFKRPTEELAEFQSSGDGSSDSPLSVFWSYSTRVDEFQQDLYELGFAIDFDWGEWQDEAERLTVTPGALDGADLVTLMKLLTLHVRKERFSGGHLANAFEQGWIVAILERLRELAA
ncbi:MAG: ADP-ribosylglycohydrolase family protein [Gemmatimonadales bacterium]|jgi:ADP-ribosyl-[dinitrogen reductase] hydrolase|nr:ADP-ribosylglycohydrolase family protein [Gemmatimonadales bacterium]